MKLPTAKQQRNIQLATAMMEEAQRLGRLLYPERVCLSLGMKGAILHTAAALAQDKATEYAETCKELHALYVERAGLFLKTKEEMELEGLIKPY